MLIEYREHFDKLKKALALIQEVRKNTSEYQVQRELYYLEHKLGDIIILLQDKLHNMFRED